jgi:transaldolase
MSNPLVELKGAGQSVWYDNIQRGLLMSGELQRLISADGVRGLTSNPAIFEKAISGSEEYAGTLEDLARSGKSAQEIYEAIAIEDIQWAADLLRPVYEESGGEDGYVSLEVSPRLAQDTQGTIEEALRLASQVGRKNLMIKVPGTAAGVPAVEHLIGEGVNVNITLLFARENYEQVAAAYIAGLEKLAARGGEVGSVASVASFFISRIDTLVDQKIEECLGEVDTASERLALRSLQGKVAVANAKMAYASYKEACASERWQKLAAAGARPQRLLWASTSAKNPAYRDVLYVEELIGPDTVNTMPQATLEAFRDHGEIRSALEENIEEARDVMAGLEELGLAMKEITDQLQADAVRLFVEPFDQLLAAIETQRQAVPKRA